ncbi:ATPase domain-containing protein [Saccharospirillum salsuginis]|uniref:non-specific serine/threonine protein kinase n=1 Tax=Saccharospirillum salsuginis TaxID=418750 RepID=A0A918KJJ4_9GAMM|nr:ATPase domain-containing protein [Saccharospirillum salsuginis]GGX65905.1 serine/threonine protein kinase [Saccharospirillum salsuginis]
MTPTRDNRLSTGVKGLDKILNGGLLPHRSYLMRGGPGSGKTTLGLHFLIEGDAGSSLFVTLGESEAQLRDDAERAGLPMDSVEVLELTPGQDEDEGSTSLLESWDIAGNSIHETILNHVREHKPERVLIDSLSQLRYVTMDAYQFRKQVLSLLRGLTAEKATVMFTSETVPGEDDEALAFLSDGVISLEHTENGRLCRINKLRGSGFADGMHYYQLGHGGMTLYPRLVPDDHGRMAELRQLSTGIRELDELTHGGLESGTVTLFSGPSGVGKTTLGAQLMTEAARRGERSVIYSFDEGASTFYTRCKAINLPVKQMVDDGYLHFEAVEPLHYNPDQFAAVVRAEVEERGTSLVMIDSLSGYHQSVRGQDLAERVHALCRYLVNMGATVLLVNEVYAITGNQTRVTEHGLSYLADNILLLRYMEMDGELRKTIGILKKRAGNFEKSIREFEIAGSGIMVGPPLRGMRGILSGVPETVKDGGGESL